MLTIFPPSRGLLSSPAVQQQMTQTVTANPQLMAGMLSNLSPSQTAILNTQVASITTTLFTPAETRQA